VETTEKNREKERKRRRKEDDLKTNGARKKDRRPHKPPESLRRTPPRSPWPAAKGDFPKSSSSDSFNDWRCYWMVLSSNMPISAAVSKGA
jgi:hypothetical protein